MRQLVIATGTSRKETKWKNHRINWDQLVKKLANTTRTPETFKEYMSLSKTKRAKIKDVGGFVGGELQDGKRSAKTVRYRDILTLDIDNIPKGVDVWFNYTMLYDCAAVTYSTHKHQPSAPRLRLIIPLDRSVSTEEYEAIGRYIAGEIGIDYFDDTTFQASRLMYWPSTSVDAEYYYQIQNGEALNADRILAKYADWKDITCWPYSSRVSADAIKRTADKQEDPVAKEGIIGAFCRTYTISEAIEQFLSEVYVPSKIEGRYSYASGSTSDGLVIYDDKFAYSHHSTDPAAMKLLNAFDLVRLHKFNNLDYGIEDSKPGSLPSFKAMSDFALSLSEVKKEIATEYVARAEDFEIIEEDDDWFTKLDIGSKKEILPTYNNIELILENDPNLKNLVSYNELSGRLVIQRPTVWKDKSKKGDYWSDADDVGLCSYIERTYNLSSKGKILDCLIASENRHYYHPVIDYLNGLPPWDGVGRVETLFIDYLGAEDNMYTRTIARKVLSAAVMRVTKPGTKWDYLVTFTGDQGAGKTSLIQKLGKEWFSDSIMTVSGKESMEQLEGVWIGEVAELTATKRADVETVKQFISKTSDDYRKAYGKHKAYNPRQCVLFGTTNDDLFLRDSTGNRRFLVIDVRKNKRTKDIWKDLDVDQIWAEVLTFYKDEELYISGELEKEAERVQKEHLEESPKAGMIREYLDRKLPENWEGMGLDERRAFIHNDSFGGPVKGTVGRDRVCVAEIWCELFRGDLKQLDRMTSREINDVLKTTDGWEAVSTIRFGSIYGRQRGYVKGKTSLDCQIEKLTTDEDLST